MNKKSVGLLLGAAILLASCSGGAPSNKDIKQAFQSDVDQVANLLGSDFSENIAISINNTNCKKQDAGRYQCSFSMTMEVPMFGEQTYEQVGVFVKRDGRWNPTF